MSLDSSSRIFFVVAFSILCTGVVGAMLYIGGCLGWCKTSRSSPIATVTPIHESASVTTLPAYTVVDIGEGHSEKPPVAASEPK
jgi:hypothetical protein